MKQKLEELKKALTTFSSKLKSTLKQKEDNLTKIAQEKNETVRQLETNLKEQSENEKVLDQLIKDFQDLANSL